MATSMPSAGAETSAPLYTSRIFTGWYTNRSPLRDGVTTQVAEKLGYGRQDSILNGQNMEITPRLTLGRRAGTTAWGAANAYQRVNRFYSFNTFTLTNEVIRVMVDVAGAVYDAYDGSQQNLIFTKSAGAYSTYFLGVGNTLYFTNGVDNMQATFNPATGTWSAVSKWGVDAPTTAPTVTQAPRVSPYKQWQPNAFYGYPLVEGGTENYALIVIIGTPSGGGPLRLFYTEGGGTTGPTAPLMNPAGSTQDGTIAWTIASGVAAWQPGHNYGGQNTLVTGTVNGMLYTFLLVGGSGPSGPTAPYWPASGEVQDGPLTWQNIGLTAVWENPSPNQPVIGPNRVIPNTAIILDPNGYVQQIATPGVSGVTNPTTWQTLTGAYTIDGAATWVNVKPFAVAATAPALYGYAYQKSGTPPDISNMSPASVQITPIEGNEVIVSGAGSPQAGVGIIVLYRTAQGGSTFLYLDEIPNPGAGKTWTYTDTTPASGLNTEWQAQISGQGTPLPAGATCLAYHLGRIFAGVGNVVWASAGPDAIVGGSSGNAGFNISFTCQSKVVRLWTTSIGLIVFTVRDAYIIQGNGIDVSQGGTGLYISVWIENLPLLSYDAFTTFGTTAFLYTGKNMVISLDPGAGIVEVSQPIADVLELVDPKTAYLTYHSHNSRDTALYLGNGQDTWYRLNPSIAPESGFAWSLPAYPLLGMSALQSVEVTPGVYQLLMGPKVDGGRIFYRDTTTRLDNGGAFSAYSDFGVITLASPGQLAGIGWMNLEAVNMQNEPKLLMLMGELSVTSTNPLEPVKRTRHDPPNLPESSTLDSTRYTFLRGGSPIWCRHLIFRVDFGVASTADELLSFTIFGSTSQEPAA